MGRRDGERNAALLGELERVGEQVLQHLLEAPYIGTDARRQSGVDGNRELQAFALRDLPEAALEVLAQLVEPPGRDVDGRKGARLDFRQVEQVVDQRKQVHARRVDGL